MNSKISKYVKNRTEPYFFCKPVDAAFEDIHAEIRQGIETATDVMTFEVDQEIMLRAQASLAKIGWTVEEACILFLYWLINCPEQAAAWDKATENKEEEPYVDGECGSGTLVALEKAVGALQTTGCTGDSCPIFVNIRGGNCYIRTRPDTTGKILGVAHRDDKRPYGGQVSDAGWLLVEYDNQNAWVSGKYGKLD